MSRRRESWRAEPAVEADALLAAMYGEQRRQESQPVPGCTARCCWPGEMSVQEAESRLWRGILVALSSEIVVALAVLALVWSASRGMGW